MIKYSCLAALIAVTSAAQDYLCVIKDCGAVPKTSLKVALEDTLTNAKALETCMQKANTEGPKLVIVPKGYAFSAMATRHVNYTDVTLQIDGVWEASPYNSSWPSKPNSKDVLDFLTFEDCTNLTIRGSGIVDGLGYDWWVREWVHENHHGRPMLLKFERVQTSEITGVKWLNAPFWNMALNDIDSSFIHDMEIRVDILRQTGWVSEAQKENTFEERYMDFVYQFMLHFFGEYEPIIDLLFSGKTEWDSWPTMPLNTDGIDPAGSNVTIRNVKITNWDDAVAVKPSHKTDKVAKDGCSQDINVENMTVLFGVGATIGSVPPSDNHACVRRVHFKDVKFDYPMKAIYVKTNPGSGTGEIKDIFYENIKIFFPIWFGIYIGPQQQEQPDGGGPGCMTYPFQDCETQPLIDVRNITLKNVTSESGFLSPGIIRCNSTNPCEDINFIDVEATGWWKDMSWTFISEYAHGSSTNSSPDPFIGPQSDRVFDLYSVENVLTFIDQIILFSKKNNTDIVGWQTLFGIVLWAISMAFDGGHF